jgi:hypothetical protein
MDIIKLVFIFLVLAITRYWMSSSKHGSEIARQLIPRDWAFSFFLALIVSLERPWYFILAFITLAFIGIARLIHVVKYPDGSQVILRWKLSKQLRSLILFFLFLMGFFVAIAVIARQPIQLGELLLLSLLFVLMIALSFVEKETCITNSGVETGSDYIRWEQIKSYRWSASENRVTHIFFKTSRGSPIFNLVQLNLPAEMKQAVNEIVARKVSQVSAASAEMTQA